MKLTIAGLLAVALHAPSTADVRIDERGDHWTEAVVTVDASPEEVYALATDYARWTETFSDIESMKVERGGREDARVRFRSRALGRTVTVQFANVPNRAMRFVGVEGPPGGSAKGEYAITPVDSGKRTMISARIYMDVDGVAALFVSERRVRGYRQAKLRADLTDLERHFAQRR
jgi:carbon monoxide dehydrogenase subunit G